MPIYEYLNTGKFVGVFKKKNSKPNFVKLNGLINI